MKVLITGGAGYVGSTLARQLLDRGHSVRVLDSLLHGGTSLLSLWGHPSFEFIRGDVRDRDITRTAVSGTEAVVHLAAIVGDPACSRDPESAKNINLDASVSLLDDAVKAGVERFVFASTCSNYGRMSDPTTYVDEDGALAPLSVYAETKVAFERVLLDTDRPGTMCVTPLRFATVYGVSPRMRFDLTVNEFTRDMMVRRHLVVFGEQFWRPYVHVQDVATAVDIVLTSPPEKVSRRVFNVGATGENYQKQQLVELIRDHVRDGTVEYVSRREDPRDYRVSFDRIAAELDFHPRWTVPEGVAEVAHLVSRGVLGDCDNPAYRN